MRFTTALICLAAFAAIAACTPKPLPVQPPAQRDQLSALRASANQPLVCAAGADCDQKWARALAWVKLHCSYSIMTHTDTVIKTAGPIEPTTDSAFTITKSMADSGHYQIAFSSTCGTQTHICIPTPLELQAGFNKFVLNGE